MECMYTYRMEKNSSPTGGIPRCDRYVARELPEIRGGGPPGVPRGRGSWGRGPPRPFPRLQRIIFTQFLFIELCIDFGIFWDGFTLIFDVFLMNSPPRARTLQNIEN